MKPKTIEELAPRMAEYLGWVKWESWFAHDAELKNGIYNNKPPKVITLPNKAVWRVPNQEEYYSDISVLMKIFFDPSGKPPNPYGFQQVWNKVNLVFDMPELIFWMAGPDTIKCKLSQHVIAIGEGPDHCHALYAAVDEYDLALTEYWLAKKAREK